MKTERLARKGRLWRSGAALTAALTLGSFAAGVGQANATSGVTAARISDVNRYGTAAQIAARKFPTGAQNAILASGLNFPDALSASFLAGLQAAPILLTDPSTLSAETSKALTNLHTKNVWIVGGTDAVSPAVASAVGAMTSTAAVGGPIVVNRIAGQTRYDTMQAIDTTAAPTQVGVLKGKATAIIAQGLDFADALSASALAFKLHLPVVLTDPNSLISQASATLSALHIGQVIIGGGTAAISASTEQSINAMGITTLFRAAGTDRTDTAGKLAAWEVANAGFNNSEIVLSRGDLFPDALAGGVYAGDPKPILLTLDPNTLGGFTSNYLSTFSGQINLITVLGGFQAVSDAVVGAAIQAAQGNANGAPGGGGNGGLGNVGPASNPATAAPNLVSAGPIGGGVQFVFDKTISTIVNSKGFGVFGPDTTVGGGVTAAAGSCVIDPNGVAVDCPGLAPGAFTLADVDGGSVTGPGGLPNVLNIAVLQKGNNPAVPQAILTGAAVSSVAFNQITYTFNGNVALCPAPPAPPTPASAGCNLNVGNGQGFGFSTTDGNTTFFSPAGSAVASGNTVTVTYPVGDNVANASYFFTRAGAVVGGAISDFGTQPTQRPNLLSVTRVPNQPAQFVFTVDKASALRTAADFQVYSNGSALGAGPIAATNVVQVSGTQFLATFPGLTTTNTASIVWGAIDWDPAGAFSTAAGGHTAVVNANNNLIQNAVGGVAVGSATTALANGPILQAVSARVSNNQATFTFDRPIAVGSVVPGDFFLVYNNGTVSAGTAVVAVSNNQVTIQFPASPGTANSIGGGLVGPFGAQPPIVPTGTAGPVAATDSAGNPAVGTSVASSLIP